MGHKTNLGCEEEGLSGGRKRWRPEGLSGHLIWSVRIDLLTLKSQETLTEWILDPDCTRCTCT